MDMVSGRRMEMLFFGRLMAGESKDAKQKRKPALLSPAQVSFVQPALVFDILGATVDPDATRYQFQITDSTGVPLDREGIVTPGPASARSVVDFIPEGTGIHSSYTVRTQMRPSCHATVSAAAHADANISPNFGESCTVCHGQGAEFVVDKIHAQ